DRGEVAQQRHLAVGRVVQGAGAERLGALEGQRERVAVHAAQQLVGGVAAHAAPGCSLMNSSHTRIRRGLSASRVWPLPRWRCWLTGEAAQMRPVLDTQTDHPG